MSPRGFGEKGNIGKISKGTRKQEPIFRVQGFECPKGSTRKRIMLPMLFRNLRFTRRNGRYRFLDRGKTKERCRFEPLSQADCLKVKTLVWMCKS